MASEGSESSSSGLGERSRSSPGHGSIKPRSRVNRIKIQATERMSSKRRNASGRLVDSPSGRPRTDSCKPVFHAEAIDPEVDRAVVIDAVHFVLSASTKGCYTLVSKFAEHLKYKISLEEKIIFLNRELKKLKKLQPLSSLSGSGKTCPISLESETARLTTKPAFTGNLKEPNITGQEIITEFVLPGAVPLSNPERSPKDSPLCTVSTFLDKAAFGNNNCAKDSLPKLSTKEDSLCFKKIFSDAQMQTDDTSLRTPTMVDGSCSPELQIDSYTTLQNKLKNAQEVVAQLKHQLVLSEQEKSTVCTRDIETQTDDKLSDSTLSWLSRSRSHSALSATNSSTKSFPGVIKTTCENCDKVKNAKQTRYIQDKELLPSIGDRVTVKGRGIGTVKFLGKLKGAGIELTVGVRLDKPDGENDGTWRYFRCPPSCGIFVPVQEVKRCKTKKVVR